MHYRCGGWKRPLASGSETFWWVSGSSEDVWFVVKRADRPLRQDIDDHVRPARRPPLGARLARRRLPWADPGRRRTPNDIVLHYDGSAWKGRAAGRATGSRCSKCGASDEPLRRRGAGTICTATAAGGCSRGDPLAKAPLHRQRVRLRRCLCGGASVLHRDDRWSVHSSEARSTASLAAPAQRALVGFGGSSSACGQPVKTSSTPSPTAICTRHGPMDRAYSGPSGRFSHRPKPARVARGRRALRAPRKRIGRAKLAVV
jgi:hypothetical protein